MFDTDARRVTFRCEANGIPVPHLHWFKNGHPLISNKRIQIRNHTELIIENVTDELDTGVYQVGFIIHVFKSNGAIP